MVAEVKRERIKTGSSELARRARAKTRRKLKITLVTLTVADLFKIVRNRKELLGSEMGTFRTTKLIRVVPNVRSKSITFQGEAYSPGDAKKKIPAKSRKPQVTFFSIDFADEEDKKHPLHVESAGGIVNWAEQLKSRKHPIQVRCTCEDFQYRWGWYDGEKKALSGPKKSFAYTRKTPPPPLGYPKVNEKELPGYCKHLHTFLQLLQKRKILI